MVFILDGFSEIGVHVRSDFGYLICLSKQLHGIFIRWLFRNECALEECFCYLICLRALFDLSVGPVDRYLHTAAL